MINKNEEGRWHTVRTESESTERMVTDIDRMSPSERKLLRLVFEQLVKNDHTALRVMQSLEYEETPVSPEKFLTDPYYFGEVGKGLYPWIKADIPRLFNQGFEEVVLTGAQRTGKDTFAHIALSYLIHLLLCLKDPATSYGLAKGSTLHCVLLSATQEKAKEVVFGGLIEKIRQSPWFMKFGKSMKMLSEDLRFPKGIVVKGAESTDLGVVGLTTCAVVIDEANIGRKVRAVHETSDIVDRTEAIYQAARRRIRTSFNRQGRPPTLLMTIGSRRYPSDFVDRRIRELQGEKNALVCDMSLYAAKGMENFSPKLFRVMVGNDTVPSRVLEPNEVAPKEMQVVKVPEDFYKDYKDDCDGSLRDISGISVRTVSPYLADQKFLVRMVDNSRSHPFRTVEWKINETRDVLWDRLVYTIDGKNKPLLYPDKPRTVAIDLGRTRNPTGFTVGFVRGFKTVDRRQPDGRMYQENLPYIVVEFALRISPVTGEEIKFWQVRELIFDMVSHGIPIKYGVMDHYQSDDFVQLLTDQGIESKQIKTDIKSYETLKAAIYEERVRVYPYKPLMDELSMLEYDAKKNKVDTSPEDFGNIHHDVADSLCLLVNRLSQGFKSSDYAPVMPEMDLINRSGPDKKYQSVAVGDTPFELNPEEKAMQQTAGIPDAKFPAYGLVGDNKEVGWGGDELSPKTPPHMSMTPNPVPRMEVLVQEFCSRVGIDKLPSVTVESIKAFLFEKQLTDHRFVRAIKEHIERVYVNQLGGKEIK